MIVDEPTRQRLAVATRFADIRELDEVDSTNRYLMGLARGGAPEGVVVVADYQSAGRGRRGRAWEAPAGSALLLSALLRPNPAALPANRRWLAGAAVAVAAVEAVQACLATTGAPGPWPSGTGSAPSGAGPAGGAKRPGTAPTPPTRPGPAGPLVIKWPNDLLLGGRKLAGILSEADAGAVVVGIGINVGWAPAEAARLGEAVDRGALLGDLLQNLEHWCGRWGEVGAAYRRHCATLGQPVQVDVPGETIVGHAEAVEADGRLRLVAPGGVVHRFSAADVVHLRPPENVTDP